MSQFQLRLTSRRYFLILLLAATLRIIWSMAVPVAPVSDSNAYDVFAQNLAECNTYGWECDEPGAYWPVGTSFVYSLFYRAFGHGYVPIIVFHIAVAVVTIALTMRLVRQWYGETPALLSGLFLAVWPSQVQMTTILASEGLFTVLIVGALAVWMSERPNLWARAALTGLLLAAACYVRPTALLVPFILAFVHVLRHRDFLRTVGAGAIMFAVMGVLIAPWTLRNHRVFGEFVLISTNGGANMWMGNNPASTGEYTPLPPETEYMNEAERNTYLRAEARAFIRENPGLFVQRFFTRLIDTHSRESISVVWNEPGLESRYGDGVAMPLKVLNLGFWLGMLLLALAGIGVSFVRFGWWATLTHPAVLFWGYYAGVHAVIVAQDRYHYPSIPMIAALAGLAAWTIAARLLGRGDGAAESQA